MRVKILNEIRYSGPRIDKQLTKGRRNMSNPKISQTLTLLCAAALLATSGFACNRKANDLASSAPQPAETDKIL